ADPGPIRRGGRGWAKLIDYRASNNSLGLWIPDRRARAARLSGTTARLSLAACLQPNDEHAVIASRLAHL
ncbi:MAG: hypothetical protein WA418_12660, partial [Bradyrhizobium sp.]